MQVLRPRVRGYAEHQAEALPPVPAVLPGWDTVRGGEGEAMKDAAKALFDEGCDRIKSDGTVSAAPSLH